MTGLFRKEALEHQGHKLDGEVTLATHMSFSVITFLLVLIVLIGTAYLFLGDYQRKEVVSGYLRPTLGLDKVYTVVPGVIEGIYVSEGDRVKKGQPLVKVRLDRQLSSGVGVNDVIIRELITQQALLESTLQGQQALLTVNEQRLTSQLDSGKARLQQTTLQRNLLQQRLAIARKKLSDIDGLIAKNFASEVELADQRDNVLALQQELENTQAQILDVEAQLSQLQFELKQLPFQHEEQVSQLKSQLAGIHQQISQAESQRSFDVISHRDGVVTSQLIDVGMVATTNQPMMTIIPEQGELEAVLLVPTRAYGFVKPEQTTLIRYQAFPYQRFGIHPGRIVEVSRSVILPNETQLPVAINEPVYRVVVKLADQHVDAYGESVPLQAGMLLEADILVDTRSLFEWLFEPLYSIRGAV